MFPQAVKQRAAEQKKDDDRRAKNLLDGTVDAADSRSASAEKKSFWASLSATPCFLPAVTDVDPAAEECSAGAYQKPPSDQSTPVQAFVSSATAALRDRAFVSRSASSA